MAWFLTLQVHHLALIPFINNYQAHLRDIEETQEALAVLNDSFNEWRNVRDAKEVNLVTTYYQKIRRLIWEKLAMESVLFHKEFMEQCLQFYAKLAELMNSIIMPGLAPGQVPILPLPKKKS